MMDYIALKAEIAKPDYSGMTDEQIASTINNLTKQRSRAVPIDEIIAHVEVTGIIDKLLIAQSNADVQANQGLKVYVDKAVRMFINPRLTTVAMNDSTVTALVTQMFASFVQASILQQPDVDGLLALGTESYPGWQDFGERVLDHGDMLLARET